MGGLSEGQAGLRDDFGPIILLAADQRLLEHALLQVGRFDARGRVLLDAGQEPAIELRESRFNLAGEPPQIRLGAGMAGEQDQ